jgi:hypothetical protein
MFDDDDDDHDDGGLSGPVWFQLGRWSVQRERDLDEALDNLSRSFSYQPAQTIVDTHELNALIEERDSLHQQVRGLRQQVQQHATQITHDHDYAMAVIEDKTNEIEFLEHKCKVRDNLLDAERERHNVTAEVKQFMTRRWFNMIEFVEHGLANEPEFRELTQLTKDFYADYYPAQDRLYESTSRNKRVYALTEALKQKCKK